MYRDSDISWFSSYADDRWRVPNCRRIGSLIVSMVSSSTVDVARQYLPVVHRSFFCMPYRLSLWTVNVQPFPDVGIRAIIFPISTLFPLNFCSPQTRNVHRLPEFALASPRLIIRPPHSVCLSLANGLPFSRSILSKWTIIFFYGGFWFLRRASAMAASLRSQSGTY